jgi:hypothetical protein
MTPCADEALARNSNSKIRAATATAYVYGNDTSLSWSNGHDKEDGSKDGYNGNSKDHFKSGPQWS